VAVAYKGAVTKKGRDPLGEVDGAMGEGNEE